LKPLALSNIDNILTMLLCYMSKPIFTNCAKLGKGFFNEIKKNKNFFHVVTGSVTLGC
jgi:hypothetical protein